MDEEREARMMMEARERSTTVPGGDRKPASVGLPSVAIIGMGYVGLTLASLLATRGYRVHGVEKNQKVADVLNGRELHLVEPGVEGAVSNHIGANWTVGPEYAFSPDVAIICVSTPVGTDAEPDLRNLEDASRVLASQIHDGTLVIVRSTVPIGTTRKIVLPIMQSSGKRVSLAFCPERTIQGQALRELMELPQVIGGVDDESRKAAEEFFRRFASRLVPVSSLEAAEMVKLVNNCHTDVIYSFGNEVALMTKEAGLDPLEVIEAANLDYPRPDLARPGFVGGACLTKDPYILFASFDRRHLEPGLIRSARELNERLPLEVGRHLLDLIRETGKDVKKARVLVCGFAYKGVPETDDMRGAHVYSFLEIVRPAVGEVLGHDFVVHADVIRDCDARPVTLEEGFVEADAVIFLNNHRRYAGLDLGALLNRAKRPFILYDCWRIFRRNADARRDGVKYAGIGYEA